jgi:hypothetical protein
MAVLKNVLIGLDQTLNCCIRLSDGWGSPDETLSARAWRLRESHPKIHIWIDRLFFWDKEHCKGSYELEMKRKQLPPEYAL